MIQYFVQLWADNIDKFVEPLLSLSQEMNERFFSVLILLQYDF